MSSALPERKPWPMKWVAAVIVVSLACYTVLMVMYRKPTPAYRPYEDTRKRVNTARLVAAGYQRVELTPLRPAEPVGMTNTALPAPGGLPAELRTTLVAAPLLPTDVLDVQAAPETDVGQPYRIRLHCLAPDEKQQLGPVDLYVKGDQILLTPTLEKLAGGLQARTREHMATIFVPAGTLKPGSYRVTMLGERVSRAWSLHVR